MSFFGTSIYAYPFTTTVTANGTNRGNITVADVQGIFIGQIGWLRDAVAGSSRVKVLAINSTSKVISLQILAPQLSVSSTGSYTYPTATNNPSDLSAYLSANTPVLSFEGQPVRIDWSWSKPGVRV